MFYSNIIEICFENRLTIQYYWNIIVIYFNKIGKKRGEIMDANKKIKKYLEENGISQVFVSRRAGINASKLSLALNGGRKLTLDEYSLICGVLGVSTDTFLQPKIPSNITDKEV